MTAQFPDTFLLRGRGYALAGVQGSGLFEPHSLGLQPVATCTACWRGYVCHYGLKGGRLVLAELHISLGRFEEGAPVEAGPPIHGVEPRLQEAGIFSNAYEGLDLPVPFTGSLLLGDDFIRELYVHMGFHPAWKYRTVVELTFDHGALVEERDVSRQMADLRAEMGRRPQPPPGT